MGIENPSAIYNSADTVTYIAHNSPQTIHGFDRFYYKKDEKMNMDKIEKLYEEALERGLEEALEETKDDKCEN